jgi:hypothetical protein
VNIEIELSFEMKKLERDFTIFLKKKALRPPLERRHELMK